MDYNLEFSQVGKLMYGYDPIPDFIGNNGDFYIDLTNNNLYGPKTNCYWPRVPLSIQGDQGNDGQSGSSGSDAGVNKLIVSYDAPPTRDQGDEGAFYILVTEEGPIMYGPKIGNDWLGPYTLIGNSTAIYHGESLPDNEILGVDGDYYIRTFEDPEEGTLTYLFGPKEDGDWGDGVRLTGLQGPGQNGLDGYATHILSGSENPDDIDIGDEHDIYFQIIAGETLYVYGPKTETGWGDAIPLTGPAGTPGEDYSIQLYGGPAPPGDIGEIGDYYLQNSDDDPKTVVFYEKEDDGEGGEVWVPKGSMVGDPGVNGTNGLSNLFGYQTPAPEIGEVGEYYFEETNDTIVMHGPKTETGWENSILIKGADGQNANDAVIGADVDQYLLIYDGTNLVSAEFLTTSIYQSAQNTIITPALNTPMVSLAGSGSSNIYIYISSPDTVTIKDTDNTFEIIHSYLGEIVLNISAYDTRYGITTYIPDENDPGLVTGFKYYFIDIGIPFTAYTQTIMGSFPINTFTGIYVGYIADTYVIVIDNGINKNIMIYQSNSQIINDLYANNYFPISYYVDFEVFTDTVSNGLGYCPIIRYLADTSISYQFNDLTNYQIIAFEERIALIPTNISGPIYTYDVSYTFSTINLNNPVETTKDYTFTSPNLHFALTHTHLAILDGHNIKVFDNSLNLIRNLSIIEEVYNVGLTSNHLEILVNDDDNTGDQSKVIIIALSDPDERRILGPDADVVNPTYSFVNNRDTGIFYEPNHLCFSLDGILTCTIDQTGYQNPSDPRYKRDMKRVENGLELLDVINPYTYSFLKESDDRIHYGFNAEELRELHSEVLGIPVESLGYVNKSKQGLTVNYSELTAISIAAIKELNRQTQLRTDKIRALKDKIAVLKNSSS